MKPNPEYNVGETLANIGLQNYPTICEEAGLAALTPTGLYDAISERPVSGIRLTYITDDNKCILLRFGRGELFDSEGNRTGEFYLIALLERDDSNAEENPLAQILGSSPRSRGVATHLGVFCTTDMREALHAYDQVETILLSQPNLKLRETFGLAERFEPVEEEEPAEEPVAPTN